MHDQLSALFDVKHRLSREAARRLPPEAVDELEQIVQARGQLSNLPRALEILQYARPEALQAALPDIVEDRRRPAPDRAAAARFLGEVMGHEAEPQLRSLTRDSELLVRLAAVSELGAVGAPASLAELDKVVRAAEEPLRRLAVLSAALVAFRGKVSGHEPVLPQRLERSQGKWESQMRLRQLALPAAEAVAAQIRGYGVQPELAAAKALDCGRDKFAVLPSLDVADGGDVRFRPSVRTIAAIVAKKAEVDDSWSTARLVLIWPAVDRKTLEVGVFRTDGRAVYGGSWDSNGAFRLDGLADGGPFTIAIDGTARGGIVFEIALSGRSGTSKQAPLPTHGM